MARSTDHDPFHCFRFAPRIGYDGEAIGVSKLDLHPGVPWHGPGKVIIESMLKPDMIDLAKINTALPLVVGVYHITDELSTTGDPSLRIVLANVFPSRCKFEMSPLDAADNGVLRVKLTMRYDRLTFLFGNNKELNVLDKMAAAV